LLCTVSSKRQRREGIGTLAEKQRSGIALVSCFNAPGDRCEAVVPSGAKLFLGI
jgi:hypothetical protein